MFSTAIFDLDGTLLDTLTDLANAGNYTLTSLQLPSHPIEKYKKMVGNGIHKLIERMLPQDNRNSEMVHLALSIFTKYYEEHKLDETAPYPGIVEMLDMLKLHHVKLAVLSNKDDAFVGEIVRHYFDSRFDAVCGLKSPYDPKPDPNSLFYLLDYLNVTSTDTLFCGDTNVDMKTAKNAGITSCGVLWGFRDCEELQNAGASLIASSPEELTDIILK